MNCHNGLPYHLVRFVSICFVSFRFVSFRFDMFRLVPFSSVSFVSFCTLQGPQNKYCILVYSIRTIWLYMKLKFRSKYIFWTSSRRAHSFCADDILPSFGNSWWEKMHAAVKKCLYFMTTCRIRVISAAMIHPCHPRHHFHVHVVTHKYSLKSTEGRQKFQTAN